MGGHQGICEDESDGRQQRTEAEVGLRDGRGDGFGVGGGELSAAVPGGHCSAVETLQLAGEDGVCLVVWSVAKENTPTRCGKGGAWGTFTAPRSRGEDVAKCLRRRS